MSADIKNKVIKYCIFIMYLACITGYPSSSAIAEERPFIAVVLSSDIKPYQDSIKGFYDNFNEKSSYRFREYILKGGAAETKTLEEISASKPTLILTVGTSATKKLQSLFKEVPIIFSMVLNPLDSGIIESMNLRKGNITGVAMDIPLALQFKYMKKIKPGIKKVGVIYSEAETGNIVKEAEKAARAEGIRLAKVNIKGAGEVSGALNSLRGNIDFLWSVADSNVLTGVTIREILLFTFREKLPFMGLSTSFVKAGSLVAIESSPHEAGKIVSILAEKVLNGQNAGSIQIVIPDKVKVIFNRNTADIINIEIDRKLYDSFEVIKH